MMFLPFNRLRAAASRQRKYPGNHQAHPDDEAEEAHDVDRGELAYAFLQSFLKLDINPMVKKVMMKKITRKMFASPIPARILAGRLRCRAVGEEQDHDEGQHVAEDEFREPLPDLADLRLVAAARTSMWLVQM